MPIGCEDSIWWFIYKVNSQVNRQIYKNLHAIALNINKNLNQLRTIKEQFNISIDQGV